MRVALLALVAAGCGSEGQPHGSLDAGITPPAVVLTNTLPELPADAGISPAPDTECVSISSFLEFVARYRLQPAKATGSKAIQCDAKVCDGHLIQDGTYFGIAYGKDGGGVYFRFETIGNVSRYLTCDSMRLTHVAETEDAEYCRGLGTFAELTFVIHRECQSWIVTVYDEAFAALKPEVRDREVCEKRGPDDQKMNCGAMFTPPSRQPGVE